MTRPLILLVDDDTALLEALPETLRLRMDGIDVDTCDSAAEALSLIERTDYDVIVTDIKMPGMDGLALLAEIKERRPSTPTLLITGHGEHELAVAALRGGAHDLIQKPIDRDYLVASLRRAIQLRSLDRQVTEQRAALEQHARVLEHIGDGVFLVDEAGVVRLWNPAAAAITGLSPESVVGRPASETIPGWAAIAPMVHLSASPSDPDRMFEAFPVELDGRELWLSISGVRFGEGAVYAFRDLTAERAVDELKREFLATASHELRTPLAAIYGAALTLRRADMPLPDDQRQELLAVISDEADRLARIVNDILWTSRIESGAMQVQIEHCDAVELASSVVQAARLHLPTGVALDLTGGSDLRVAADPDKVRQVLANLVDNAVKYSPGGGRVEVALGRHDGAIRFAVSDEGLGIPAAERERVFEKFYRLDPDLTRGVGGTGLGLFICRELARRMDGWIWIEGREPQGSTVVLELPAV